MTNPGAQRLVFVGNRAFVWHEARRAGLPLVESLAIAGTYFDRQADQLGVPVRRIGSKRDLLDTLAALDFDLLLCNGVPHILPISRIARPGQRFINVHPGPLPDLRGADPVNGAILLDRPAGAAVHVMDDGIDTGPLIARRRFPVPQGADVRLLYQMVFEAERQVFRQALARNFEPDPALAEPVSADSVYYTIRTADRRLQPTDNAALTVRKVRAFATPNQAPAFRIADTNLRAQAAAIVNGAALDQMSAGLDTNQVVTSGPDFLVLTKPDGLVLLDRVSGDLGAIGRGSTLKQSDLND
ncbi:hypothetical protein CCR85_02530 [Rhodothalassium salexigens]|uniref:formyltransferase family protein n=1 Tax=Rhodothalassium salexigens TaxID=1086 RepID=UPI00191437F9|nr:formyltransferase family protein [Rhodothalassium salexigens]MBK5910366.1 hypothetical protein [Rhodothalassium salexigens]MBK5921021.1 hypothetical protein [Rhodothalassium salexigens]